MSGSGRPYSGKSDRRSDGSKPNASVTKPHDSAPQKNSATDAAFSYKTGWMQTEINWRQSTWSVWPPDDIPEEAGQFFLWQWRQRQMSVHCSEHNSGLRPVSAGGRCRIQQKMLPGSVHLKEQPGRWRKMAGPTAEIKEIKVPKQKLSAGTRYRFFCKNGWRQIKCC